MDIYEKKGWIYYAQTDHLKGEEIGTAIEALYDAGASNVQVISTITKKNRPGELFLLDVKEDSREAVEQALILETGVTGWHCIASNHRHLRVDYLKKKVFLRVEQNDKVSEKVLELEAKRAYGEEITLRPEHRSCETLKKALADLGLRYSIHTCERIIGTVFENNMDSYMIREEENNGVR